MRASSKPKFASSAKTVKQQPVSTENNADKAATAMKKKKPASSSSPFLINPIDGNFLDYNDNNTTQQSLSTTNKMNFAVAIPQPPPTSNNNNNSRQAARQRQQQASIGADDLSDSDEDIASSMMMSANNNNNKASHFTSSSVASNQQQQVSTLLGNNSSLGGGLQQQRELSKFEQKRMKEASQRQKDNIVQPQQVRGAKFEGSAFRPNVKEVRFDDFTMDIDNKTGKVNTYSTTVTFTNVSLAAASMRPDSVPREHADCLIIKFTPCGMVSPGMHCSAVITFAPKVMEDIATNLSFTTSTGKLLLPVVCRVPRLGISVSTKFIDFDLVTVGTVSEKHITIRNSGSLSTSFMIQGELIDDLKSLKHPTVSEMIAEKRIEIKKQSSAAEEQRVQQLEEANRKRQEILNIERELQPLLSEEEVAQAKQQQEQLLQLQQQQILEASGNFGSNAKNNNNPQRGDGSNSARGTNRKGNNKNAAEDMTTPRRELEEEAAKRKLEHEQQLAAEEDQERKKRRGGEDNSNNLNGTTSSSYASESHPVFTLIETDTCDAGIIDDILHGETVALNPSSSVTVAIRFHPHRVMNNSDNNNISKKNNSNNNIGLFESSFFVAFEAPDIDDVPVLVTAQTKDLPVFIEQPTDVVDMKCGYFDVLYRSEVTLRNNKNVSVRVSPKVPPSWRDHVTFTPTTAVIQPQEPFTFRIKLTVPDPSSSALATTDGDSSSTQSPKKLSAVQQQQQVQEVLFQILFELADENLPLITFLKGKFCANELIVTPQDFSFGIMNENEFYSKTISITNPGLLPRFVCVSDFPSNVTITPRTAVSLSIQKKRAKQLAILSNPPFSNNQTNMIILPDETFQFDIAMRPPDAPAPGLAPAQDWTDTITLRCDDDSRLPINVSGSRRKPPLEFSYPFVMLPRCAVWDNVSVSVVLKNKTNSTKSFSFANLHPKLGIRVSPVSGEIEKHSSVIIVVEFHAHGSVVETLPMLEADLRPTEAEMAQTTMMMSAASSPMNDTKKSSASAARSAGGNKNKNQNKEEAEQMAKEFAAIEDTKKRLVKFCEHVCDITKEELTQVQPWEQAVNDAQRVTQQLVQPGEPSVDLFLSALENSTTNSNSKSQLPLPFGSTTSLFSQLFFSGDNNNSNGNNKNKTPLLTRTVVIPCHIQGWSAEQGNAINQKTTSSSSWIGLSVRCTAIPPTVLAESHTTKELLEIKKSQQVRELQSQRQKQIENQVSLQMAAANNDATKKPRTPRGQADQQQQQAESLAALNKELNNNDKTFSPKEHLAKNKKFEDSHVFVLFPPTASITGKSTNSIKLSFASMSIFSSPAASQSFLDSSLTLTATNNNMMMMTHTVSSSADQQQQSLQQPPKYKKVFVSVTPLDPHGPFQLLVPPKTELTWPELLSTECTFAFRPKYSALYRVEGSIVISSPESGIIHQIRLRFEGQGLPTSFAVSTDRSSLVSEAIAAAEANNYPVPPSLLLLDQQSSKTGGRPTSARGGSNSSPSSPSSKNQKGNNNNNNNSDQQNTSDLPVTSTGSNSMSMTDNSPRDVPALRLSLGNSLIGSSRAQDTVFVLNRSTFPITCKFDVASHRSCPAVDNGGALPFAVEPTALHLAPFSVGEAVVSCSTLTSGTFLSAIRVTTSEDTSSSSGANNNNNTDESTANTAEEKIESEAELFVSSNVWDYPVFALLPSSSDRATAASKMSHLIGTSSQAGNSGSSGSKSGQQQQSSNSKENTKNLNINANQASDLLAPLWLLPPTFEKRLRDLSLASPLELSVVSRKQKSLTNARSEALKTMMSAISTTSSPLLGSGGAHSVPLLSAAMTSGSSASSSSTTTNLLLQQQQVNTANPLGRDLYFGQSHQPGSCAEYPLTLNFITRMNSGDNNNNDSGSTNTTRKSTAQTATIVSSVIAAEKTALTTTSSSSSANQTSSGSSPGRGGGGGAGKIDKNSVNATLLQNFSAAGAQAKMLQNVAPGVAHQIVVGFSRGIVAGASSNMGGGGGTGGSSSKADNNANASNLTGEFSVDTTILDPVAQRQGWRVDPPRGTFNVNSPLQRLVFSFTPTAALVNALPVPGVSVSSSIDVKLTLKYSNADAQTIFLKLNGQVKR